MTDLSNPSSGTPQKAADKAAQAVLGCLRYFEEGYLGERNGVSFLDNPYISDPPYSTECRLWVDGYVKSMQDRR
jgi:hypothetical protein